MLPELMPLVVVDDKDVEELVRSGRADLAKLSLELRALQHEGMAARLAAPACDAAPILDLAGADELLRRGVEAHLARRRVERRDEVERAQREATHRIADAEAEAAALIDAARAQLLQALTGTESSTPCLAQFAREPATSGLMIGLENGQRAAASSAAAPPPPPPPTALQGPAHVGAGAPALRTAAPAGAGRRNRWHGFLHIDVLLPLVAVLIVAVLLLAWMA